MSDITNTLEEAFDLIQTNPEESLLLFDEILEVQPYNTNALNGKASAYMKLNKIDLAEELFDKSISIKSTSTAWINKGLIAKKKHDYENALEYYNRASKINPKIKNITRILKNDIFNLIVEDDNDLNIFSREANILVKKGLKYKKENKYQNSLKCYELAIQKDEKCEEYIDSLIHEINVQIESQLLSTPLPPPVYSEDDKIRLCKKDWTK